MKRLIMLMLVLTLALSYTALAQTAVDPAADRGISPRLSLGNNPAIPGESMTTGLPTQENYIPVLVNIDNVEGSWPQWGIAQADIIYEMPIHGTSLTRLMELFAYEHPENAGPVRSARVMHVEMRQEWDAAWAYFGLQNKDGSNVNETLNELEVKDRGLLFNGSNRENNPYFSWMKGYENPHHHNVNVALIRDAVADYPFPQRPFLFSDELPESGIPAQTISLTYSGNEKSYTNSHFEYDVAENLYSRYRHNKPYDDKDNPGTALKFSNFIVQWTELTYNGAANAPLLKEVGEGNADIFMGGQYIPGYWVRESLEARTVFYDQDGEEIRLQRGKTFITIASDRATELSYE